MGDLAQAIGRAAGGLIETLLQAKKNGGSKADAERELARAAERGDLVSDALWDSLDSYVESTRNFEQDGAG